MNYYVGIDLHSNNSYLAIINEKGEVKFKGKPANDVGVILKALKTFERNFIVGIVVESTFNWYWLVDALQEAGYKVHLANPSEMEQYTGLKHTDDKSDAIWLAEMLRLKILPTGYIYPREERALRDLLRKRMLLVRHRTSLLISLKGTIHNWTGDTISRSGIKKMCNEEFPSLFNNKHTALSASSLNNPGFCKAKSARRAAEPNLEEIWYFRRGNPNILPARFCARIMCACKIWDNVIDSFNNEIEEIEKIVFRKMVSMALVLS